MGLSTSAFGVTEFVCTVNEASEDYNDIGTWEGAMDNAGDLTDGTVLTGNYDNASGTIADNANVTWDAGVSNGTLIHMTGTQYLIDVTLGSLDDNDTVDDGGGNTFDVDGTPDSAILKLEVYDDQGDLTGGFNIDGLTTSATNYIHILAPAGERHDGTVHSGGAEVDFNGEVYIAVCRFNDNNCIFEWMMVNFTDNSSDNDTAVRVKDSENTIVRNCIIYDCEDTGSGSINGLYFQNIYLGSDNYALNNVIYGIEGYGLSGSRSNTELVAYNNTIYDCGTYCYNFDNGTFTVWNCVGVSGGTADFEAGTSGDYNFSKDDSAPESGGNSIHADTDGLSIDFTNTSAGTEDLHLASTSDAIDQGTDLGTGQEREHDIDNRDRDAEGDTWDMGADETVAAAPSNYPQFIWVDTIF